MADTIEFDPGISELCDDFYSEVYVIENDIANMPQYPRKARYYSVTYKRILKTFLNNLAFYQGCLAWAYYIVNTHSECKLSGNPFNSYTEEQKSQYAPTAMVDFVTEYLEKFKSDLKYFHIKNVVFPENTNEILETYRSFLAENEGFINVHNVSEVKLPEKLKFIMPAEDIKAVIDKAIENKNLNLLLDIK
ncbi:MAG: hypothetical protein K6C94_10300 [Candidatus Gastranaerophilales bacterium]|nr:hypothetical protein [Candidatus Gastranaerophilales bacterium]